MICYCGHVKSNHESERDQGYHQGRCDTKNCNCTSYRNKVYVESNGQIKQKWHKRIMETGNFR